MKTMIIKTTTGVVVAEVDLWERGGVWRVGGVGTPAGYLDELQALTEPEEAEQFEQQTLLGGRQCTY